MIAQKRFHAVPADAHKRIAAADEATLSRWLGRIIDAPDLSSHLSEVDSSSPAADNTDDSPPAS